MALPDLSIIVGVPVYDDWQNNMTPSSSRVGINVQVVVTSYSVSLISGFVVHVRSFNGACPTRVLYQSTVCSGKPRSDIHVRISTSPSVPVIMESTGTGWTIRGTLGLTVKIY